MNLKKNKYPKNRRRESKAKSKGNNVFAKTREELCFYKICLSKH